MSRGKRRPLLHRGIKAPRVHPCAPFDKNNGRATDRALSLESESLMLDFFTTLEFDFNIAYFQRQPVEVGYLDSRGTQQSFCPEFLITYRQDITPAKSMKPLLCDVLTRTDIIHYWPDFKNRVRSANKYARARKWTYRVLTEREIRTPFLQNAQLLLPYRSLRAPAGV